MKNGQTWQYNHTARAFLSDSGEPLGLDSKYFERRDESIPLRGLVPSMHLNKGEENIRG